MTLVNANGQPINQKGQKVSPLTGREIHSSARQIISQIETEKRPQVLTSLLNALEGQGIQIQFDDTIKDRQILVTAGDTLWRDLKTGMKCQPFMLVQLGNRYRKILADHFQKQQATGPKKESPAPAEKDAKAGATEAEGNPVLGEKNRAAINDWLSQEES